MLYVIPAHARLKYYRYNNNVPMAEMTLQMMIAAGLLDEIPATLVQDGNPYSRSFAHQNAAYSIHNASIDPYSTLPGSPLYGRQHGAYNYPYSNLYGRLLNRNPYSYLGTYNLYNDPLRYSSYGPYYNRPYGYGYGPGYGYGNRYYPAYPGYRAPVPYGGPWGNPYGTGPAMPWGNAWQRPGYGFNAMSSPWANPWTGGWPASVLNPASSSAPPVQQSEPATQAALTPMQGSSAVSHNTWRKPVTGYASVPVQNPALQQYRYSMRSPYVSSGRLPLGYGERAPSLRARHISPPSAHPNQQPASNPSRTYAAQRPAPAVTDGQRIGEGPNIFSKQLEGLWRTDDGEFLGLRNDKFLWTDGADKYESGTIEVSPDTLHAITQDGSTAVTYSYRFLGEQLETLGPDGRVKVYSRVPVDMASASGRDPVIDRYNRDLVPGRERSPPQPQ